MKQKEVARLMSMEEIHEKPERDGTGVKKYLLSMSVLLIILAASCQKDDKGNKRNDQSSIHVTANLSQGEVTKADIEPGDKGAEVFWTSGDMIGAFGKVEDNIYSYLGNLTTPISERAKKASFEGNIVPAVDESYYVFYPANSSFVTDKPDGTSLALDLAIQEGTIGENYTYLSPYMYMVSKEPGVPDNDNKIEFVMKHLCALLQFNITVPSTLTHVFLKSISVSGNNLADKKGFNVYTGELRDVAGAGNQITLGFPNKNRPDLSSKETTVAMTAFPASGGDLQVRVIVENDGVEMYQDFLTTGTQAFEAGKRYNKTMNLDALKKSIIKPVIIDPVKKTALITNLAELAWVADVTNVGNSTYSDGTNYNGFTGWTLTQGKKIDLDYTDWTPIGVSDNNAFKGTYNGAGYEIENALIGTDATGTGIGLFGYISFGTIENLILSSGSVHGNTKVGGIAGHIDNGLIINCINKANVNAGSQDCGGLVGEAVNISAIIASVNYGLINASTNNNLSNLGGIAGRVTNSAVIASINHGHIDADMFAGNPYDCGGVVGLIDSNGRMVSCINEGIVDGIDRIGGVVGHMNDYDEAGTKELYFVNNSSLKVSGGGGNNWLQKGPSTVAELNSTAIISSLNDAIAEWNNNNPAKASPSKFAAGEDNAIPKLVSVNE